MTNPNKRFAKMRRAVPMAARSQAPKSDNAAIIEAIVAQMNAGTLTPKEAGDMLNDALKSGGRA